MARDPELAGSEPLRNILGPTSSTDLLELRAQFKEQHPEVETFIGPDGREGRRLWKQFLGIRVPPVPSHQDPSRDASCLTCHDGYWVYRSGLEVGHPDFGKAFPCPDCSGWDEYRKQKAMEHSGIPKAKRKCTFESFQPVDGTDAAIKATYDLGMGEAEYSLLLLYGCTGNGKSHLAYAATLQAESRGLSVKFWHVASLMGEMRKAMQAQESAEAIIEECKKVEFLVLDDLGAEQGTDWQAAALEDIINHRYAHELPTLVTTNRDIKELSQPLLSRFRDTEISRLVLNEAVDYRPKKG